MLPLASPHPGLAPLVPSSAHRGLAPLIPRSPCSRSTHPGLALLVPLLSSGSCSPRSPFSSPWSRSPCSPLAAPWSCLLVSRSSHSSLVLLVPCSPSTRAARGFREARYTVFGALFYRLAREEIFCFLRCCVPLVVLLRFIILSVVLVRCAILFAASPCSVAWHFVVRSLPLRRGESLPQASFSKTESRHLISG